MLSFYLSQLELNSQSEKFAKLYTKHRDKMMSAAFAVLKNHHDAEEAVQNALFAIAKNINSLPDPDTRYGANYAVKAAKNHALNMAKKRKTEPLLLDICAADIDIADDYISRDEAKSVVEAICAMKPIYRDVLTAKYLYGMTAKEIASVYGLTLQTVKSRLSRGTKILKEAFERSDIDV